MGFAVFITTLFLNRILSERMFAGYFYFNIDFYSSAGDRFFLQIYVSLPHFFTKIIFALEFKIHFIALGKVTQLDHSVLLYPWNLAKLVPIVLLDLIECFSK